MWIYLSRCGYTLFAVWNRHWSNMDTFSRVLIGGSGCHNNAAPTRFAPGMTESRRGGMLQYNSTQGSLPRSYLTGHYDKNSTVSRGGEEPITTKVACCVSPHTNQLFFHNSLYSGAAIMLKPSINRVDPQFQLLIPRAQERALFLNNSHFR